MKESSAEDSNRNRRVEDVFRVGFEDAQAPPPARLWDNLDQALENQELKHYRTQAFWYRSVAAACLLLLLTAGAFLWQQDQLPFLVGEGQMAKAPSVNSNQSGRTSTTNTRQAIAGSNNSEATQEREASVFGSNPEKQAINDIAESSSLNTTNANQSSVERNQANLLASSSASKGSSEKEKASQLAHRSRVGANRDESTSGLLAGALVNNQSQEGHNESHASAVTNGSLLTSESTLALEQVRPAASALSSSLKGDGNTPDSLLNSKMATVLYQGEGRDKKLAKVEVESTAAAVPSVEKPSSRGWMLALAYTPMYAYAPIAVSDAPSTQGMRMSEEQQQMYMQYDQALQEYRQSYSPAYSYSARLGAGYQLDDHWQIESGFLYARHEATTTHSFLFTKSRGMRINSLVPFVNKPEPIVKVAFEPELINELEAITPTEQYRTKYRYQQIGVPLRIAYHKSISKVFAFVSGGVNLHLLLNNRIESENPEVQSQSYHYKDETSPFRAWQWAATTSAGIGYQMSRKMSLMVAPELTYSFSSALKESQAQADPYQLGVSIGGRYRLAK